MKAIEARIAALEAALRQLAEAVKLTSDGATQGVLSLVKSLQALEQRLEVVEKARRKPTVRRRQAH